jgi:pullulanase
MKTFQAYFDNIHTVTVELGLNYYNGVSRTFTIMDEDNKRHSVLIKNENVTGDKRVYELYVEELIIGKTYTIVDEHFLRAPIEYRYVVRTDAFDQMFYYNGPLGSFYTETSTQFIVWAPTASRVLVDLDEKNLRNDKRRSWGV